jgi:hypothetical protein
MSGSATINDRRFGGLPFWGCAVMIGELATLDDLTSN